MLAKDEIKRYLNRIAYTGSPLISFESLRQLHCCHLLNIPFENLDIALGGIIRLDKELLFNKIIDQNRGGFCYELNYCFAELLAALGFSVRFIAARVFNEGEFGKEFAHLVLLVSIQEQEYIVDVGFGRSFVEPIRFKKNEDSIEIVNGEVAFKVISKADSYVVMKKEQNLKWLPLYQFSDDSHEIADFIQMCDYQQSSKESIFTSQSICSIATPNNGRKTISNGRYIESIEGVKNSHIIENEVEYRAILLKHFYIELPEKSDVESLLAIKYSQS